ncbi:hypothetical protein RhiirC2_798412 [Rhizophagus irregularis]|uniref:Uncharacterized protein n=1 Tax=Rhizophagus irregularis TaxID=588596 RepID=A0A2N1M6J7_9GLOM|nr:hypothetical protein RhiirC2_798412 [Rhizophagus irregularis]
MEKIKKDMPNEIERLSQDILKYHNGYKAVTRVFCHDYSNNPYIDVLYSIRNVHLRYKIIALGYYPQNIEYMQKSSRSIIQYQIPDAIRYEMKYILVNKVSDNLKLISKEGRAEYSQLSL